MKVSVIIPSLDPDDKLVTVVDSLIAKGFDDIILVNDGSSSKHMWPFEKVAQYSQCTILTHEVNKGKGRGLKTAFEYCLANRPDIDGVVTVDGDNQHQADDIYNCCEAMIRDNKVVLGVRDFSGPDVPPKSKFGNNMTSFVFKHLCRLDISDTQTGLRAIPRKYLQTFIDVAGERFEYETNMLLEFKRSSIPFEEVTIATVYIEENASTHFNPVKDSIKIYKVIFKYMLGTTGVKYAIIAVLSWIIDNALFNIFSFIFEKTLKLGVRIFVCTAVARVLSSIFNYFMNRNVAFKSTKSHRTTAVRYYTLWLVQMMISFLLVELVTEWLTLGLVLSGVSKIIIDLGLFLVSYQIQKRWVFRK